MLYSTSACHLCEQAEALLHCAYPHDLQLQKIDIAENDDLLALYGIRIPVIQSLKTGKELGWPFTEEDLKNFV